MTEGIKFRVIKLEGGVLLIRPEKEDLGKAMALVRRHKDKLYELTVKEYREKRSMDANAYAWVLIHKLAEVMGMKPTEVYLNAVLNVGNNYTPMCVREQDVERFKKSWQSNGLGWPVLDLGSSQVPGCRNLMAYHGSSTYDTKQMSRLIDGLVQDCKALDIETLPPEKLALMKEAWDA
jgi:hypothetical protein